MTTTTTPSVCGDCRRGPGLSSVLNWILLISRQPALALFSVIGGGEKYWILGRGKFLNSILYIK